MRRAIEVLVVPFVLLWFATIPIAQHGASSEPTADAQEDEAEEEPEAKFSAGTFAGLKWRGIGPALMSGRISDIVVVPGDWSTWYVATASGGIWKTGNAGTTWTPIFDDQGSYAIGCITLDPENPFVVWVGTGENNSQRSVGYGDGVYKSLDGGKSWKNVGLEDSFHIGRILIDPRDSDTVYVAAQGPLWSPGGDRGLYKTVDGGENWERVLEISEHTGVTDVVMDPRDPDVLYAATWQRRRHVAILYGGGPESTIHKSTDAGATWRKIEKGLPDSDKGRIGLAVSPIDPDVVYAWVESLSDESGFFRSSDRGENWEKKSDYYNSSGQYYGELWPDPHQMDRLYAADTFLNVTDDGGATWSSVYSSNKHVDNHAIAFDPEDPNHLLIGCDGGLYETWDSCETYRFFGNLPLTQFYNVGIDDDLPFYNVYGGTQDNNTQGGPVRTNNTQGIRNSDWFVTVGGDGFQTRVDPEDPNILYSQWQYAGLVRYDKKSGEQVEIQPQPGPGEPGVRWHWNSPLIISPHSHTRLYFAGDRVFRSDDRGDTWMQISPDLSKGIDRNQLEVMGRLWSVDTVNRNNSSSPYGTVVSLDESPLVEGLLYVGTDDGLVQVTEDGGASWHTIDGLPGVPELAYSSSVVPSQHDADTVFVTFENHKRGDYKPYVLESTDRGRSWTSIAGDLPEDEPVWCLVQDHVREDLLFVATEFGVYFTVDGGGKWLRLKGGIPTISVRDMEIQRRENDLVLATFGRSFYVLDDYSPLRFVTPELLEEQEAMLFPVRKTRWYVQADHLGGEKGSQGDSFYTAPNPPFGAVFTYYLKEGLKKRRDVRREAEAEALRAEEPIPFPSWDELRAEDREKDPAILLHVYDADGQVVNTIAGPIEAGIHRVAWDLRYPDFRPADSSITSPWDRSMGPLAVPGTYSVRMFQRVDGDLTPLGEAQTFETVPLGNVTLPAMDRAAQLAFQRKLGALQRAVLGASRVLSDSLGELQFVERALAETPGADASLAETAHGIEHKLRDVQEALQGDRTKQRLQETTPPSIQGRIGKAVDAFATTNAVTTTQRQAYDIAAAEFEKVLAELTGIVEGELAQLREKLEEAGAPWTPGRGVPRWKRE